MPSPSSFPEAPAAPLLAAAPTALGCDVVAGPQQAPVPVAAAAICDEADAIAGEGPKQFDGTAEALLTFPLALTPALAVETVGAAGGGMGVMTTEPVAGSAGFRESALVVAAEANVKVNPDD